MRLADVSDYVFDMLMDDTDKVLYNLFYLIRSDRSSFIVTDDKYYIYAQNSRRAPHWLFIKEPPDEKSFEELVALIAGMIKLNPLLKINGSAEHLTPVLDAVADRYGSEYRTEISMSVCACEKLTPIADTAGRMITPKEEHRKILLNYITEMQSDITGYFMPGDDNEKLVNSLINSGSLFLWENEKIVSMAKVAHKGEKFARINTVFTDSASRGKGYTKMLIGQITSDLLEEGLTPIIYADMSDEMLLAAYDALGYKSYGTINQFAFI